jgi:hypothetical protein
VEKSNWKAVLAKLEVEGGPVNPVQRPVLRRYERKIGLSLPEGYKAFCQTIGPGELTIPNYYRIYVPQAPDGFNIELLNQKIKAMPRDFAIYDIRGTDRKQLGRGVYFASDIATSHYFWDPEDITNDEQYEYGIYGLHRDCSVERLCDTFWAFINDICLGDKDDEWYPVFIPGK